jgi:trehalose utilization protein
MQVTVWGENVHEHRDAAVAAIYPEGMHQTIAAGVREHLDDEADVRTATLAQPDHGLGPDVLGRTDVLTWWGHAAHEQVSDEVADRVCQRVLNGMGLVALHSAHYSKVLRSLLGTTCSLRWRNDGERELVWTVAPDHPIAAGVPPVFTIPRHEMYGEFFDIPPPEELIFISSFAGGEVFRSGCCFTRGRGRVFYFSPGDQDYPVYHQPEVRRVIANAVRWAAPRSPVLETPYEAIHSQPGWFDKQMDALRARARGPGRPGRRRT